MDDRSARLRRLGGHVIPLVARPPCARILFAPSILELDGVKRTPEGFGALWSIRGILVEAAQYALLEHFGEWNA
jgi:hypothetical protein